jgi:hypothetical protein
MGYNKFDQVRSRIYYTPSLLRFDIDLRNNLTEIRRGGYTILFRKMK